MLVEFSTRTPIITSTVILASPALSAVLGIAAAGPPDWPSGAEEIHARTAVA
jgi:hypothetical protein